MPTASDTCLAARGVSFSYGNRTVLDDVSIDLSPGETVALAGPNGSGKTTLLRIMAGALRPNSGEAMLGDRPLASVAARERARLIAVVPQDTDSHLTFSVETIVGMGRTPHLGLFATRSRADNEAVEEALDAADSTALRHRRFDELSGGERQRVVLAMALAQQPRFLLLDEPTVHLDLQHQSELLELLVRLRDRWSVGILAVMHDLNLAGLYFDQLAILSEGRLRECGPTAEVLKRADLASIFAAPLTVVPHPSEGVPQVLLERTR